MSRDGPLSFPFIRGTSANRSVVASACHQSTIWTIPTESSGKKPTTTGNGRQPWPLRCTLTLGRLICTATTNRHPPAQYPARLEGYCHRPNHDGPLATRRNRNGQPPATRCPLYMRPSEPNSLYLILHQFPRPLFLHLLLSTTILHLLYLLQRISDIDHILPMRMLLRARRTHFRIPGARL